MFIYLFSPTRVLFNQTAGGNDFEMKQRTYKKCKSLSDALEY